MLISCGKAARMCGVTTSTIHAYIREGKLRSWKLGARTTRLRFGDVKEFLASKLEG